MSTTDRPTVERPMRILVVDDDPDMLNLLEATLEEGLGGAIQVEASTRPEDARTRLEGELFDVLVTDLEMPGISGLQLLRCAKRRNAWTQVIIVTGHSGREALNDAMDLGASDYLLKPLDPMELEQALREASARFCRWRRSLAITLGHRCCSS